MIGRVEVVHAPRVRNRKGGYISRGRGVGRGRAEEVWEKGGGVYKYYISFQGHCSANSPGRGRDFLLQRHSRPPSDLKALSRHPRAVSVSAFTVALSAKKPMQGNGVVVVARGDEQYSIGPVLETRNLRG